MVNNQTAIDAFVTNIAELELLLLKLTDHVRQHLDVNPETLDWGSVGDSGALLTDVRALIEKAGI